MCCVLPVLDPNPTSNSLGQSQGSCGVGQACLFSSDTTSGISPFSDLLAEGPTSRVPPQAQGYPSKQLPLLGPSPSAKHSADTSFSSYRVPLKWLRKRWLRHREVACPAQSHTVRGRARHAPTASSSGFLNDSKQQNQGPDRKEYPRAATAESLRRGCLTRPYTRP